MCVCVCVCVCVVSPAVYECTTRVNKSKKSACAPDLYTP